MEKNLNISLNEKKALIDYFSGHLSAEDSKILSNWLEKSEANKLLFDQLSDIWQSVNFVKYHDKIDIEKAWEEIEVQLNRNSNSVIQIWLKWTKIAAIFILVFVLGGIGHYFLSQKPEPNQSQLLVEYVAPLGSRSFIKMSDGSKIWLNAGTTLSYKHTFGNTHREVILSGEAYFEIAKNPDIPFVVQTSDISITALGTQFNVKAYAEEKTIETTLIEGSVKLEGNKFKLAEDVILNGKEKAVFTKQNRTLDLADENQPSTENETEPKQKSELRIITSIEPDPIISWKDERWLINNEKLSSLSQKLERRYAVNFIFDNELLKDYSFGGTLEDETLEQVLDAICSSSPIKYLIEGKTVYIMPDKQRMDKFKHLLMR
ncbi:FecR family protein [Mariniphaga sp.]|uniref:FecR family protein n=1 Tax=Mariniphaga sp. TaxID=1954475 RepID=UPI003568A8C6